MKKKTKRLKSLLSLIAVLSLLLSLGFTEAFAVTQSEIDEIQRQKDELTAMRRQSQQKVDELEAQPERRLESGNASAGKEK